MLSAQVCQFCSMAAKKSAKNTRENNLERKLCREIVWHSFWQDDSSLILVLNTVSLLLCGVSELIRTYAQFALIGTRQFLLRRSHDDGLIDVGECIPKLLAKIQCLFPVNLSLFERQHL